MYSAVARAAASPVSHFLLAGLSAVAISVFAHPASADEAYLCGPDSIIYVSAADLPKMKRTNACIAAYYGLTVETPEPQAKVPAVAKPSANATKPQAAARAKTAVQAALKPLVEPDAATPAAPQAIRQAALTRPFAAPGTDYRNVRVLNATSDEAAVFRHTK